MKTLLLVGATGVVGHSVLQQALAHPDVGMVVAPTRRALAPHPKLHNPVVDFKHLPSQASWWRADAVVCTLGTTIGKAGSAEAFRAVDLHLVRQIAVLAHQAGTPCFVLNSSTMANPKARGLYLRTKGEAEQAVQAIGFDSLTIARPGLLDGQREEFRLGEEVGLLASRLFNPLLPKRLRSVKVDRLAKAMLACAVLATPGEKRLESEYFQ
ncbi:NAD(P)H-binding protein [Limnobacter sp.]|uniref:NAD(P)H-binding protein n=1 Tax=Limnobacter sp. TaxID=2003368 RepID=UPI0035149572